MIDFEDIREVIDRPRLIAESDDKKVRLEWHPFNQDSLGEFVIYEYDKKWSAIPPKMHRLSTPRQAIEKYNSLIST